MKKLKPLVPALLSFGPGNMVMGLSHDSNFGLISACVGAIMLSTGLAYILWQVSILEKQADPSEKNI